MKTRILLATIGAAALTAITFNANASDALLTPRAQGNQIKHFAGTYNDPNLIDTWHAEAITPRAAGNQAAVAASADSGTAATTACVKMMSGSPKAIQACTDHPGSMPGCNTVAVAPLK